MTDNGRGQIFAKNIAGPQKNEEAGNSIRLQCADEKIAYSRMPDDIRETKTIEYAIYGIDIYKPFDESERYD